MIETIRHWLFEFDSSFEFRHSNLLLVSGFGFLVSARGTALWKSTHDFSPRGPGRISRGCGECGGGRGDVYYVSGTDGLGEAEREGGEYYQHDWPVAGDGEFGCGRARGIAEDSAESGRGICRDGLDGRAVGRGAAADDAAGGISAGGALAAVVCDGGFCDGQAHQ